MSWQKLSPQQIPWHEKAGFADRTIANSPSPLTQLRLEAGHSQSWGDSDCHLVLISSGVLVTEDDQRLEAGDLIWLPGGATRRLTASSATELYDLVLPAAPGSRQVELIRSRDIPWQSFDDPAGRPTQPVQILMDAERLSVLRTRFVPTYSAGEHWHDFDTWYFITAGNMRFGHEGIYETGEVRQVTGGYSYGPEEPGDQGVEFVLVSVGGPVALHWADLEAAPQGPLPPA